MPMSDFFQIAKIYGGLAFLGALPGSPADRARLRRGDVVIAVNGSPTPDLAAFLRARQEREGGATVRYIRDGAENEVELVWNSV
jgi:S1-C subfamily serine protease